MGKFGNKLVIGILGGIASGKSAVAAQFAALGCAVIDADKMAKEMLDEPSISQSIAKLAGEEVLDKNRRIDKAKLASLVFNNPAMLEQLTNILHPPVLTQTLALISAYETQDNVKAIVLDMPLLAEVGWDQNCDVLVFVNVDPAVRNQRAALRGLGGEQIKSRENFQISLDKKRSLADYIVDNNSDLSELGEQVSRIFSSIINA
ncbi:MAG: dephospho-CoA kinase [Planctomycetes bacterium GWF2_50_10]|nr:MAG: dephospho-CoA kinase [Planctomycetes bacterium GWF2_50_10]